MGDDRVPGQLDPNLEYRRCPVCKEPIPSENSMVCSKHSLVMPLMTPDQIRAANDESITRNTEQ
jgi:hypothetical protein